MPVRYTDNMARRMSSSREIELDDHEGFDSRHESALSTSHNEATFIEESNDEFLKVHGKGLCGVLERIPLQVKIALVILTSFIGFCVLGTCLIVLLSNNLKNAKLSRNFQSLATDMGQMINAIQEEREISNNYLETEKGTQSSEILLRKLDELYEKTDISVQKTKSDVIRYRLKSHKEMGENLIKVENAYVLMQNYRQQILARNMTTTFSFYNYKGIVSTMIDLIGRFSIKIPNIASYITMVRLIEAEYGVKSTGSLASLQKTMPFTRVRSMTRFSGSAEDYLQHWLSVADERFVQMYEDFGVPGLASKIKPLVEYTLGTTVVANVTTYYSGPVPYNIPDFNGTEWAALYISKIGYMKQVEGAILDDLKKKADQSLSESITFIVVIVVAILFFSILCASFSLLFALTIVAPWKRLNKIQEAAVNKFSPKDFLRMLNCKSIVDAKLGLHVSKQLSMISVRFNNMNFKEKTEEQIVNKIISYTTKIFSTIKRNGGIIDKYEEGVGFTAVFYHEAAAIRAATQISERLNNKSIGIGIHTSQMLVASIGSEGKMEICVVGDNAAISSKIRDIMSDLDTGILVTRNLEGDIKCGEGNSSRMAGFVSFKGFDGSKQSIKVYEIFKNESAKSKTIEDFEQGVEHYQKGEYEMAEHCFEKVIKADRNDNLCRCYYAACETDIQNCVISQEKKTLDDLLSNEIVYKSFKDFVSKENSVDLLECRLSIQKFKERHRRQEAEIIYKEFFRGDAASGIDVAQYIILDIENRMAQAVSSLFDKALQEIEVRLMPSIENSKCRASIQDFKREPLREKAEKIYTEFFKDDAPSRVNIGPDILSDIENRIDEVDRSLFDRCLVEIDVCLVPSIDRFKESQAFADIFRTCGMYKEERGLEFISNKQ